MLTISNLYSEFKALWRRIGAKGDARKYYNYIIAQYSKNRFHHGIYHIIGSLNRLSEVKHLLKNSDKIEFALWYHDIIYNENSKTNEKDSADLAHKVCIENGLNNEFAKEVQELILMTSHLKEPKTTIEKIIIDIDLSTLGHQWEEFERYAKILEKKIFTVQINNFIKKCLNFSKKWWIKKEFIILIIFIINMKCKPAQILINICLY